MFRRIIECYATPLDDIRHRGPRETLPSEPKQPPNCLLVAHEQQAPAERTAARAGDGDLGIAGHLTRAAFAP